MIFAGIGCRTGVVPAAVVAAVDAALTAHGRARSDLAGLATGAAKREETAIAAAAAVLALPLSYIGEDALADVDAAVLTFSKKSQDATGSSSLSEASALAAAGQGARLLGARTVLGSVTCALAETAP